MQTGLSFEPCGPSASFPVIRDLAHQRNLAESSIIIEYLDRMYPGKPPLIPDDWNTALEVRLWDRFFDNHVQGPVQKIVGNRLRGENGDLSGERAQLQTAYAMLDQHIGARPWVASPDFSLADCAAAPALFYACTLEPFPEDHRHLNAYFERLVQRPSVQRVIDEARPYFSMYPFVEAIAERFR
jgi:glutathione S-transferase